MYRRRRNASRSPDPPRGAGEGGCGRWTSRNRASRPGPRETGDRSGPRYPVSRSASSPEPALDFAKPRSVAGTGYGWPRTAQFREVHGPRSRPSTSRNRGLLRAWGRLALDGSVSRSAPSPQSALDFVKPRSVAGMGYGWPRTAQFREVHRPRSLPSTSRNRALLRAWETARRAPLSFAKCTVPGAGPRLRETALCCEHGGRLAHDGSVSRSAPSPEPALDFAKPRSVAGTVDGSPRTARLREAVREFPRRACPPGRGPLCSSAESADRSRTSAPRRRVSRGRGSRDAALGIDSGVHVSSADENGLFRAAVPP